MKFATLREEDLVDVNQYLETRSTIEIIQWSYQVFSRIAFLTSGQKAGSVLAKILFRYGRKINLIFADTGVLFPETYETIDRISQEYNFPLKRYAPKLSMRDQNREYGVLYLDHVGQEQCCHMRKVEPLLGINQEYQALFGPLRRGEGGQRSKVPIVSLDPTLQLVRINPMANQPKEEWESFLAEEDTIINPLHEEGYPTIGCVRCTTPVRQDEPPRAGRWRHLSGVDYCGINPSDFFRSSISIKMDQNVIEKIKNLPSAISME